MTDCSLLKPADHTKTEGTADMVESSTAIQGVLGRLKE